MWFWGVANHSEIRKTSAYRDREVWKGDTVIRRRRKN
jgi:hypothetical protein